VISIPLLVWGKIPANGRIGLFIRASIVGQVIVVASSVHKGLLT
jgi:hypothetical protein